MRNRKESVRAPRRRSVTVKITAEPFGSLDIRLKVNGRDVMQWTIDSGDFASFRRDVLDGFIDAVSPSPSRNGRRAENA